MSGGGHHRPTLSGSAGRHLEATAHDIFSTRVWQARLPALAPYFPIWTEEVATLRAAAPIPAGRTNRQGWNSSDLAVLERPVFAELRGALAGLCAETLHQTYGRPVAFHLQSWINMHDRGGFNFAHMHAGCLLSGCFYLQVPPGAGALMLRDPRPGVVNGVAKGSGHNAFKDIRLEPEVGLAVLFPHWLEHFVEVHEGHTPRISIPFNAVSPAEVLPSPF
jgi:uncharacterized protein (TIGR02466 family)